MSTSGAGGFDLCGHICIPIHAAVNIMAQRNMHSPYCIEDDFTAPSEALLLMHIRLVHSLDPNFRVSSVPLMVAQRLLRISGHIRIIALELLMYRDT